MLELKKRKLELELAATQKQLGLTPTTMPTVLPTHPTVVIDPTKISTPKDIGKPPVMPAISKPVTIVNQATFIPNQMPPSNVRTRIAPVNSALVNSMRSRDPRLRQSTQTVAQTQPPLSIASISEHYPTKLGPSKYYFSL